MPSIFSTDVTLDELGPDCACLRHLVADLGQIHKGLGPTEEELTRAPLLDGWRTVIRGILCLQGRPVAHPILSGRRHAVTSPVWVLDPVRGYARTESRFYRLGRPAGMNAHE